MVLLVLRVSGVDFDCRFNPVFITAEAFIVGVELDVGALPLSMMTFSF